MESGNRKKQKTENLRNNQQRFAIQQHNALIQESVDARKLISSKEIKLGGFQLGMVLYFAPLGLQIILLIALFYDLQNLFIYLTLILLLNLVVWISIPVMTKSLANQIQKLDKRTKHLDNL
jgi:cytochrome c biogenesis protein CcdA